jgi:hypothetical protein
MLQDAHGISEEFWRALRKIAKQPICTLTALVVGKERSVAGGGTLPQFAAN